MIKVDSEGTTFLHGTEVVEERAFVLDPASTPKGEAHDEYEEPVEAPSAIPALRRKFEKQNAPPPQAHNCYVGCPCLVAKSNTKAEADRVVGRLRHQAKLSRRAGRAGGVVR